MTWIIQAILSFLAATGFGIIFNAPRRMLFHCGFVGMTGWLVYSVFYGISADPMQSSFLGAFCRCPRSTYFCTESFRYADDYIQCSHGIIPLVPGGMAYNAMRHIVENDFLTAISYASGAFMVSGAIAMGLVFAEVMFQLIFRSDCT